MLQDINRNIKKQRKALFFCEHKQIKFNITLSAKEIFIKIGFLLNLAHFS